MTRGLELEDEAVKAYELQAECETQHVGFITTDDGLLGASPDRMVGKRKGLELKCPSPQIHMQYLLMKGVDDEYKTQLMGQMLVGELDSVDIFSYHPELPCVIIPVQRDEDYIAKLKAPLYSFAMCMIEHRRLLEERFGPFARTEVATQNNDGLTDADIEDHIDRLKKSGVL